MSQKHQVGDVENDDEEPDDYGRNADVPRIAHLHYSLRLWTDLSVLCRHHHAEISSGVRSLGLALNAHSRTARLRGHVLVEAGEPDERGRHEGQHDAEDDLRPIQRVVEARAARGAGDDDAGGDGNGPRDEAAEPGLHLPPEGALADHLPGDGADDAGRDAREEQCEGEDDASEGANGLGQQIVDAEDVGVRCRGVPVEAGAGDDQDGAVNEESECEEGYAYFGVSILEGVLDGC